MTNKQQKPLTYRDSGVDIDAGEALVDRIKPMAARTMRDGVMAGIGGFGAMFEIPSHYKQPVLVSGTDGVGTKLRLAFQWGMHSTIGIDLVAMSVNDILVQGAEPLFFLDYFACGKLSIDTASEVVSGIAKGCEISGCALIGGETAEMPGMYPDGEYDLAGFAVGAVEKENIITGKLTKPGDTILGLASSGAHSNGYSLLRKVIEYSKADSNLKIGDTSLKEAAMAPTRIYVKSVLKALSKHGSSIRGMSHITGGGLVENIPRVLHNNVAAKINRNSWEMPALFKWLQEQGNISDQEMLRVFNCGIGMALIVSSDSVADVITTLESEGETVYVIGEVVPATGNDSRISFL